MLRELNTIWWDKKKSFRKPKLHIGKALVKLIL